MKWHKEASSWHCEAGLAWLSVLSLLPAAANTGSVIACNAALSALAEASQPQRALRLLLELPVERWSVVTLNTLMPWMPWAEDGEVEWDPELWQRSFGIRPNLMSYNEAALLSECLAGGGELGTDKGEDRWNMWEHDGALNIVIWLMIAQGSSDFVGF